MKVKILTNYKICHDGINPTQYIEGDTLEVIKPHAERLIELGVAEVAIEKAASPVVENKAADPVKVTKRKKKK